jgi:hypothetical protein
MLGVVALTGRLSTPPSVQAQNNDYNPDATRIREGFRIAPVPLDLEGKDPDLALAENTFASQLVRIQTERGQHVIDNTPVTMFPGSGSREPTAGRSRFDASNPQAEGLLTSRISGLTGSEF